MAAPASAQGRYIHPHSRNGAMPLERILPQIRKRHPGTFSDVDGPFADPAGRLHYRLKWLTPEGRVIWLDTDARSGHVLGINHGWGGYGPYPRSYLPGPFGMPGVPPPRLEMNRSWRAVPAGRFGGFRGGFRGGAGRRGR
ncbi:MAG TPA: hypothetical protein VGM17_14505 [Rhizomicrobium sp.]|jgi:hypothetical protein